MKILLVDDNENSSVFLKKYLETCGYSIDTAVNGARALEHVRRSRPDLIISDILMPEKDGFELCYWVKTDEHLRTIPFIFYTATYLDKKDEDLAMALGASRFLVKPMELTEFSKEINKVVQEHKDGKTPAPELAKAEIEVLRMYTAALARKLDKKVQELEHEREALQHSEQRYRRLLEDQTELICRSSRNGELNYINDAYCKYFGKQRERLIGYSFLPLMPDDDGERLRLHLASIDRENPVGVIEHRVRIGEETRWLQWTNRAIFDSHGNFTEFQSVGRDITDRKQAEEALRESEEKFRTLAENIPGVIYLCKNDKRWSMLFLNDAVEDLTGYPKEDFLSDRINFVDIYHPNDSDQIFARVQEALSKHNPFHLTYRIKHKSGEWRWVDEVGVGIYRNGEVQMLEGFISDITERVRFEAQLRQAHKMEAIGTLAGGLAHDFNNLLGVIIGYIELSQGHLQPESEIYDNLSKALKACISATALTNQFITFSQGGRPVTKTGSIVKLCRDSSNLVLAGSNVKCEFCIPEDLWPVDFDERQIKHVFNNLFINAREAMLEGGTIEVNAENVNLGDERPVGLKAGRHVKISIKDHGVGIAKEYIEKIFDPYFSTKQMGAKKGTGLGLATVYSIIKKHRGDVKVESEVGKGTTVSMYFPASEKEIVENKPKEEKPLIKARKILVMDDEQMIRNVARMMLNKLGYEVEEAKDGFEAIEMYKRANESASPFDVVILDLTVKAGMGGKEAIQKLLEINPGIKAIVSSGYSNDEVMTDYRRYGFSFAIPKPYSLADLRAAFSGAMSEE